MVRGGPALGRWSAIAVGIALVSGCVDGNPILFPPPSTIEASVAPDATGRAGELLDTPVEVTVRDRHDNPLPRVPVTVAVLAGGGSIARAVETSGEDGLIRVRDWRMGERPGPNVLRFSAGGLDPVTVEVHSGPGLPARLDVIGPNPEPTRVASAIDALPSLRVVDRFGTPVPGVEVAFEALQGGEVAQASVTTDADGSARPPEWTLGPRAVEQLLRASVSPDLVATIRVQAIPGAPEAALWDSLPDPHAEAGLFLPHAPIFRVTDRWGNGVAGLPVEFAVVAGGGSIAGLARETDAFGRARVERWTLGPRPGTNRLRASVPGFPDAELTADAMDAGWIPQGRYFRVRAVHINQATQRLEGDVPLIRGRPGLLRVFVEASEEAAPPPPVEVRLFRHGREIHHERVDPAAGPALASIGTAGTEPTWNVRIPGSWMEPGLELAVTVDPEHEVGVVTRRWTDYPEDGTRMALPMIDAPTLRMRFLPLTDSETGVQGDIHAGNLDGYVEMVRRMLPVGRDSIHLGPPFVTNLLNVEGRVRSVLSVLRSAWLMSDFRDHYFHGIFPTSVPISFAGIAYLPAGPSQPAPIAMSFDRFPDAPFVVAHELGHNLGVPHAPCGNPTRVDPAYPYPGGTLGRTGYDHGSGKLLNPSQNRDLMSYCGPRWISDYNYELMMDWRASSPMGVPGAGARDAPGPGLLVWGEVDRNGVRLQPALPVTARPFLPGRGGTHRLRGLDLEDRELFAFDFEPDAVPHASDPFERHFGFVVPLDPRERARLDRIEVVTPYGTARESNRTRALPAAVLSDAAAIRSETPTGEALEWDPEVFPLVVVRHVDTGEVVGMDGSGRLRLDHWSEPVELLLADGLDLWSPGVSGAPERQP